MKTTREVPPELESLVGISVRVRSTRISRRSKDGVCHDSWVDGGFKGTIKGFTWTGRSWIVQVANQRSNGMRTVRANRIAPVAFVLGIKLSPRPRRATQGGRK